MAVKERKLSCNDLSLYNAYTAFDYTDGVIYLNQSGIVRYNVYVLSPDALEEPEYTNEEPEWDTSIPVSEREGYYLIYTGAWYVNKDYNSENPILLDKLISIMRRRLSITMPDLTVGFDSGVTTDEYAYRRFCLTIFDGDFEDIYKYYHVLLSNDSEETFNNSHEFPLANKERIMTNAINGHADSRQFGFFTVYSTGDTVIAEDIAYKDFYCELVGSTEFDFSGQSRNYQLIASRYGLVRPESENDWITITKNGTGITISVTDNKETSQRQGSVKLYYPSSGFGEENYVEYTITQEREHFNVTFSGQTFYEPNDRTGYLFYEADGIPVIYGTSEWILNAQIDYSNHAIYFDISSNYVDTGRTGSIILQRSGFTQGETVSCQITQGYFTDNFLRFEIESGGTINWQNYKYDQYSGEKVPITISYRINGGQWNQISSTQSGNSFNVDSGDLVEFKGVNDKYGPYRSGNNLNQYSSFKGSTAKFKVSGNIMTMLYGENAGAATEMPYNYTFTGMFRETNVTNAEGLLLPSSSITAGSYEQMFSGCTLLQTIPQMSSATTIGGQACMSMFDGCTSLQYAPELDIDVVNGNGFRSAFRNCYTISSVTMTFRNAGGQASLQWMFAGCTGLVDANILIVDLTPSLVSNDPANCAQMFEGCVNLVTPPILSATTLYKNCYNGMFYGCTSLVNAPELPATTLANDCYRAMFYGCTSLINAPALPATTLATECYYYMFANCTSLVNAPILSATTLTSGCYRNMFTNCASLVTAPALSSTSLAGNCYREMFAGCTSLVNAPELPALTLAGSGYYAMFSGCTSLVTAPALSSDTADYNYMFDGCSSLNNVVCLATTNVSTYGTYTNNWLRNVSSTGTITIKEGANWGYGIPSGVPEGWTIIEVA